MDKRFGHGPGPAGHLNGHLDGERLCDYAEGTLATEVRAAAEVHLQGCEACRRELKVVQGYFAGMAALEPVKAPANFLAQVRARIETPSPWKAFWSRLELGSGLPRPLRFIPAQIVVLTVLGIGIITLYVHNNGGLESRPTELPMASTAPAPTAPPAAAPAPVAAATPAVPATPATTVANDQAASMPEESKAEDRPLRKKASMEKNAREPEVAPELPKAMLSGKDDAGPFPESAEPAAKRTSPAPQSVARRAEAPADAKELESPELSERAPMPSGSASGAVSESGGNSVPGNAIRDDALQSDKSRLQAASTSPCFIVRMRSLNDSTALVSGLKAMGAEPDPGPQPVGAGYAFRIPASLSGEIQGYLERYGSVERQGNLPAPSAGAQALFRIRLLSSAKQLYK